MNIARIRDGVVTNIETASTEWLREHEHDHGVTFVKYDAEKETPFIGYEWNAAEGFQPPPPTNFHTDAETRFDICRKCDRLDEHDTCTECGCWAAAKVRRDGETCPIGKW